MARINAQNVSLAFPMYASAHAPGFTDTVVEEDRLIFAADGNVKGIKALDNISLDLRDGDRLAVIGANGSGKTTLLQVLSGIITPDAGEVAIYGRATNLININLGMQSQATGHRNITLRGLSFGQSHKAIEAKRNEIIEFSELGRFIEMPIETYSAGMRMRLSFAIATAFEPEILILDEWLSTGDASFRQKATDRMQSFVNIAGVLVLASHSQRLLEENCNKAIWLSDGKIRAEGPVTEIFNEYKKTK